MLFILSIISILLSDKFIELLQIIADYVPKQLASKLIFYAYSSMFTQKAAFGGGLYFWGKAVLVFIIIVFGSLRAENDTFTINILVTYIIISLFAISFPILQRFNLYLLPYSTINFLLFSIAD